MTCKKILAMLEMNGGALAADREVSAHLRDCPVCTALLHRAPADDSTIAVDGNVLRQILSYINSDLRPVTPLPPSSALVLGFLTVFTLLALSVLSLSGSRNILVGADWRDAIPLVVLAGGAVSLAMALSKEIVPGERAALGPKRTAATVLCSFALSICLLLPWRVENEFMAMGWQCTTQGFAYALPATVLVLLIVRRGAVMSPASVGALTGAFSGLVGVAILHFQCVIHNAPHLLVWHAAIPVACAAAGYLLGHYVAVAWPSRNGSMSSTRPHDS